jgi:HSP20 family protein
MSRLRREMDELFDRFFGGWPAPMMEESGWMRPWGLDVTTEGNEMLVRAEVPGFEPNDLDVRVEGEFLSIRAERKHEEGQGRSYGRFEETVRIPAGTDPDKVRATYHNGILEVRMPVPEKAQGKRINVQGDRGTEAAAQRQPQKKAAAKT